MEVRFPKLKTVLIFHRKQLERYGGSLGLRDQNALESALAAAQHRHVYEGADWAVCAATYAYHLSQAHAFLDGNKRIAWGVPLLFLEMNGIILTVPEAEAEALCLGIAASSISRADAEQSFAHWIMSLT